MTNPLPLISSSSHFTRSLSEATIQKCMNAASEDEIDSLWSRTKDFFLGTHKTEAKLAVFQLAHASTLTDQIIAFNTLTYCVDRDDLERLRFDLSVDKVMGFQIDGHTIPPAEDIQTLSRPLCAFNLEATCRLLDTLYVNDHHLLSSPEAFGLQLDRLHTLDPIKYFVGFSACRRQLMAMPALLETLMFLELHRESPAEVEKTISEAFGDLGTDFDAIERMLSVARNAKQLVRLVSDMRDG